MAYIEIRKDGKLVTQRLVADQEASRGCNIRLGKAGNVKLGIGESKQVGKYHVSVHEGQPSEDAYKAVDDLKKAVESIPPMKEIPNHQKNKYHKKDYPCIEGFEITGRLGEGGMGTVWRGIQLSTKREVAIKFLSSHRFSSKKAQARFEREVALAAKLTHPNIAGVYHSGVHRGVYYYAMELIDGVHLDKFVYKHDLDEHRVVLLMNEICDAIAHAHKKGIIHRDLKPSNILVTKQGKPCIVDFGLAKATHKDNDDLTISVSGEIAGTPAYMAPEQAAGRSEQVGPQTDVYALGTIFYQLVTGNFPHIMHGSKYDVMKSIIEDEVVPPREHRPDIDRELESIILKTLEKEPEDRYANAEELTDDIENYLAGRPMMAKSMSGTYLMRKRLTKARKSIIIAAVSSFAVILLVLASFNLGRQNKTTIQEPTLTETPKANTNAPDNSGLIVQERSTAALPEETASSESLSNALESSSQKIIYVDVNAEGANSGLSWKNAYTDLQTALQESTEGTQIWVSKGVYYPDNQSGSREMSFNLKNKVAIYGGFSGTESNLAERNIQRNTTVLSGDLDRNDGSDSSNMQENSYHVVIGSDTNRTAILDGFTITGGNANGDGPIGADDMFGRYLYNDGGGLYNRRKGSPTIRNCSFIQNCATDVGGAIYNIKGSSPHLINCFFERNYANAGQTIFNRNSSPVVNKCRFRWAIDSQFEKEIRSLLDSNPSFIDCQYEYTLAAGNPQKINPSESHTNSETAMSDQDRNSRQHSTLWQPQRAEPPAAIKVDGEPFFVLCARSAMPKEFPEYAQAGFNVVSTHWSKRPALPKAQEHGLFAIARGPWFELPGTWSFMNENKFDESDWQQLRNQMDEWNEEPALFSWALPTDPIVKEMLVSDIKRAYELAKELNPDKPAFLLFASNALDNRKIQDFLPYTDVLTVEGGNVSKSYANNLDKAVKISNGKSVWIVIGANKGIYGDYSSPEKFRATWYQAINHGVSGLLVDGFHNRLWGEWKETEIIGMGDPQLAELRQEVLQVTAETKPLIPSILAGHLVDEVFVFDDGDGIDCKAFANENNSIMYIVAVNITQNDITARFKVPSQMEREVQRLRGGQLIHDEGIFSDQFNPYQTHIYALTVESEDQPSTETALQKQDGLVLYMDFDEAPVQNQVIDKSGHENHGTLQGAEWTQQGKYGGCYYFEKSRKTDRILVPDSDSLDCRTITLAAWIRTKSNDDGWNRIIDKDCEHGYNLCLGGVFEEVIWNGKPVFERGKDNNDKFVWIAGEYSVADGKWHHIAATFNGQKSVLYIDGVAQKHQRKTLKLLEVNDFDLAIGNSYKPDFNDYGWAFNGWIDEVYVYNMALSDSEIVRLYNNSVDQGTASGNISAEELTKMKENMSGSMVGIGVKINYVENGTLIQDVLGQPAQEAGLKIGDVIKAVDGKSTVDITINETVDMIKGPEGSIVTLDILTPGGKTKSVEVTRSNIIFNNVSSEILPDQVGLLKISGFNNETYNGVIDFLDQHVDRDIKSIILDLRGNTGGLYSEVIKVVDLFVPAEEILWFTKKADSPLEAVYSKEKLICKLPLAVLVDENTLSGGELLAAGIKRTGRGKLIGHTTSGTAAIKKLEEHPDGSADRVKVADFYYDSTTPITNQGILPDVLLPEMASDEVYINKATEVLNP